MHVAVIGAGIVGAATALALLDDGHRVSVIDPAPPGGPQAASFGNGCWLNPGSVVPMSMPGLWRKVPGWLADPLGPLTLRPSYLPAALPWLWRFLRAGATPARARAISRALAPLLADAPVRHAALAQAAGVGHLIRRQGLMHVFPDRAAFEAEAFAWQLRREAGIAWLELDEAELRQREPSLDRRYTFAVLIEAGGHCTDPGAYVAALIAHAEARGASRVAAAASGFRIEAGRLRAVRLADGREIAADRAVIAAGARSAALAREAGDRVPLQSERGYHVEILDAEAAPRLPIMPSDGKMAITPMDRGLRIAGQVEIAAIDAAPNWARARILRDFAQRFLPGLARDLPEARLRLWMGHRPSTPDGLPCIGPARASSDIVHAFGHGHVGLAGGVTSARLAADLVSGRTPSLNPAPYRAARFA
ncbi:MAG: FAD-dependent oxidoreductase [Rhodospirillales bacterium]|nr:FAD-dependent oxidoreductase [Rhodospirillales bacterium]